MSSLLCLLVLWGSGSLVKAKTRFVVAVLLLLFCCCCFVVAVLLFLLCCCCVAGSQDSVSVFGFVGFFWGFWVSGMPRFAGNTYMLIMAHRRSTAVGIRLIFQLRYLRGFGFPLPFQWRIATH